MSWIGLQREMVIGLGLALIVPGCGILKGKQGGEAGHSPEQGQIVSEVRRYPLGEITFLNPSGEFVLIRALRGLELPEGSQLESVGDGPEPTASLVLSPERKRAFLVADIRSGSPQVGDRVNLLIQSSDATDESP
ncbi:MAG: hypothetical protein AAGD22_04890 [Verrucomicrobiota bacterium]